MTIRRIGLAALVLGLLASGTVLAEKFYVAVNRAEVLDEPNSLGEVVRKLKLDEEVDADSKRSMTREDRARSRKYVAVTLSDGTKGYIMESMLSDEMSISSAQAASVRASSGSQSAGAAASGFTGKIEGNKSASDPEFKANVARIDMLERHINTNVRKSPDGTFESADPSAAKKTVIEFAKNGGLR